MPIHNRSIRRIARFIAFKSYLAQQNEYDKDKFIRISDFCTRFSACSMWLWWISCTITLAVTVTITLAVTAA